MRDKGMAAGASCLRLHVSGDLISGLHHYPHGLQTAGADSSASRWMKSVIRTALTQAGCRCLAGRQPVPSSHWTQVSASDLFDNRLLVAAVSSSPSTGHACSWRLQRKLRGLQNLGQHATSILCPQIRLGWGACYHFSTNPHNVAGLGLTGGPVALAVRFRTAPSISRRKENGR